MSVGLTDRTKVLEGIRRMSDDIGFSLLAADLTGDVDWPRVGMVRPVPRGGGGSFDAPPATFDTRDGRRCSRALEDFLTGTLDNGKL